ncbi:hypothetical protein BH10ACT3_BH10ACT3_02840 [soil metagenome]
MFERTPTYDAAYISDVPARIEDYLPLALAWAAQEVKVHGGELTVVAPGMSQFRSTGLNKLPKHVKTSTTKKLGPVPHLTTVVIACWPDRSMLERVDGAGGVKALLVLPWLQDEINWWLAARGAVDILGKVQVAAVPTISDPAVLDAMTALTMAVNLSSGLTHPSDKRNAVTTFRRLRKAGHVWSTEEIQTWASANGWDADDARVLAEMGAKILAGGRVHAR